MNEQNRSDVVIIGGVAAGPKTAATLARRDSELSITLFEKGKDISYASCGLPYFASGDVNSFSELTITSYGVERNVDFFDKSKGFKVRTGSEVIKINRQVKTVTVKKSDRTTYDFGYDKLVVATGASPLSPPFPIQSSHKIRHFTKPEDALDFRRAAQQGEVGSAVIVGGGFIGCELAEAMGAVWGIDTTLIEMEEQLLPRILDPEMSAIAEREMARNDIKVKTGISVIKIELNEAGSPVVFTSDNQEIETDYVFLCLGVNPNIELAVDCGIKIGETGAIAVNDRMQTSDPDIYAGGDCIESESIVSGRKLYLPMGSLANRHGRVIAENIVGNDLRFPGVTAAFMVKVFDINIGSVGFSEQYAGRLGLNFDAVWGSFVDKPDYFPESGSFTLKMIYENLTGKLIGLQAVGRGDICRRIDVFSAFLTNKSTIQDLLDFEHGYAPPYSEALDPLHHLAAMALARQRGTEFAGPKLMADNKTLILDVREKKEAEELPLPLIDTQNKDNYLNIPLNDLKANLNKINRDKNILIICRRGPRAYQTSVILKSAGFTNVSIIGGGTQAVIS